MAMSILLTLPEVQAQLRVSRATVRRLIRRGQLPIVKIGRRTLVTRQAVKAFVRQQGRTLDGIETQGRDKGHTLDGMDT